MGARTGAQYLAGLRDGREVWLEGERVDDVTEHPRLQGAALTLASLFDLQHEAIDDCLVQDSASGELVNASHLIPRSKADLDRRHRVLERFAEQTVGLMGRTPDYLNVTFAGFAGMSEAWAAAGNEKGAERLIAFQRDLALRDLALTHTIIHPTIDKALGNAPAPGNDVALQKVDETNHGIIVRGSRILATLAPFSDEIAVYPGHPLPEGADAYALSFSIPMETPGLKTLCRDSFTITGDPEAHPLSSRFDEQDAFMIFDDVEVPWERVFINGSVPAYNSALRDGWFANIGQQTMIRAQTKLEFAYGLATRMAAVVNDKSPATQEMLGEIWTYAELARAAVKAAEDEAHEYPGGVVFPSEGPMQALRAILPQWFPRVNEIIRLIGSHNLLATPTMGELLDPELGPLVERYLRGAGDVTARQRIAVFRLAWDFAASGLGSRIEQYERFYLAGRATCLRGAHGIAPKERAERLVSRFLVEAEG